MTRRRIRARARPVRTLPKRALELAGHRTSTLAERRGWDTLIYNPVTMWSYHRLAERDAEAVAAALTDVFPDCKRYADIGAGSGAFAAALRKRGVLAVGHERSWTGRLIGRLQGAGMQKLDLEREPLPESDADLAYCFEVAEHLRPALADRLITYLACLAPLIVFTAAHPGQGGYGHINERPLSYWEAKFSENQCTPWSEAAEALSAAFGEHGVEGSWFYDNLRVFRRRELDIR